jgi:hypothetical protein
LCVGNETKVLPIVKVLSAQKLKKKFRIQCSVVLTFENCDDVIRIPYNFTWCCSSICVLLFSVSLSIAVSILRPIYFPVKESLLLRIGTGGGLL